MLESAHRVWKCVKAALHPKSTHLSHDIPMPGFRYFFCVWNFISFCAQFVLSIGFPDVFSFFWGGILMTRFFRTSPNSPCGWKQSSWIQFEWPFPRYIECAIGYPAPTAEKNHARIEMNSECTTLYWLCLACWDHPRYPSIPIRSTHFPYLDVCVRIWWS